MTERRPETVDPDATDTQQASVSPLAHHFLDTPDAIAAEAGDWNTFVERNYNANPFLMCEWQLLWIDHFAREGTTLRYARIERDGKAVGYAPFVVDTQMRRGVAARVLSLGGAKYNPVNCIILANPRDKEILPYIARHVLPDVEWDSADICDMPEEYPGAPELAGTMHAEGHRVKTWPAKGNWICRNGSNDFSVYLSRLDASMRRELGRKMRRLTEACKVSFEFVARDLEERHVEAYQRIYAASWKDAEESPGFFPNFIRLAARKGWLQMGFLLVNDQPVAVEFTLVRNGWSYHVKCAYDKTFAPHGVGNLLFQRLTQHLMEDAGVHSLDFLKGDDAYKKDWTTERRRRYRLLAYNRTLRGKTFHILDTRLLPWVRRQHPLTLAKEWMGRLRESDKGESTQPPEA